VVVHAPAFRVKTIERMRVGTAWLSRCWSLRPDQRSRLLRRAVIGATTITLIGALCLTLYDRLHAVLWLDDIPITSLANKDVAPALEVWWRQFQENTLRVTVADAPFEVKLSQLDCVLDVAETARRAERAKNAHFWRPVHTRRAGFIDVAVTCPEAALHPVLDEWEKQGIQQPPKSATLVWERGAILPHPGEAGNIIERAAVKRQLESDFVRLVREGFSLPVTRVEPKLSSEQLQALAEQANRYIKTSLVIESKAPPLKAHLLHSDLGRMLQLRENERGQFEIAFDVEVLTQVLRSRHIAPAWPAKNASLSVTNGSHFAVVPEARGYRFSIPKLAEQILHSVQQGETRVPIDAELGEEATLKAADVGNLGIHELMGVFTTHHACCQPRVNNIHRIADLLDGIIVLPGATFSVNETIGPRSLANGFVMAPSIEDGEMVDTIGGGVSQFATTFYNALLRSGLEIQERRAHTYWFDRYPMGHEATLSFPKPDLVFRNDTRSGVLIKTEYTEKSITVRLYGDKEHRQVAFGVSKMMEVEPPPLERLPNPDLNPEKEHTKNGGRIGWSVTTWRTVTLANGEQKKDERKVTYKPQVRRIEVHPCKLRSDELGYTGERCPKSEPTSEETSEEDK